MKMYASVPALSGRWIVGERELHLKPLVLPTINLNGTSREQLLDQLMDAYHAAENLIAKLGAAAPHGRDYIARPLDYPEAKVAWLERIEVIVALCNEIVTHIETIQKDT